MVYPVALEMEVIIRKLYPNLTEEKLTEMINFTMDKVEEWDGSNANEQPGCSTWNMEERIANKSVAETQRFVEVVWEQVFAKYGKPAICLEDKTLHGWILVRRKRK